MKDSKLSIPTIIRFFLGILLLATGLAKIPDFSSFTYTISKLVPFSYELIATMTNESKSKIILLVNRADFNCNSCFQNFLAFCDALKEMEFPQEAVSIIVKNQPRESESRQLQMLKLWHNQLGINYPMILDRIELYEQSGVEKTTLVLLDNENQLILYETIPMKASRRLEILSHLKS